MRIRDRSGAEVAAPAQRPDEAARDRFAAELRDVIARLRQVGVGAAELRRLAEAAIGGIDRVGLGHAAGLGAMPMVLTGALVVFGVGGTIFLALRYGQGGARLERAAGTMPLTTGLADNRNWVLGMFYVNRDDPSIMVERRFGLGYTINFGNPWAVLLLCVFLVAVLGLAIVAVVTR